MIFNENKYGEYLYNNYKNEELKPKIYTIKELSVIAKYLRCTLKQPSDEVKNNLIKFCNINYIGFDEDVKYQEINKAMEIAYSTELRTCNEVVITKGEWEQIQKLSTPKGQRLLMVILAVSKFNRINPIVFCGPEEKEVKKEFKDQRLRCYLKTKDLFKIAKLSFANRQEYYDIIGECVQLGLVDLIPSNRVKMVLNFGSVNEVPKEEIQVTIKDMTQIVDIYNSLNGKGKIKQCVRCGEQFVDNSASGRMRLCTKCHNPRATQDKKNTGECNGKLQFCEDHTQEEKTKLITCIDCGITFGVDIKNHKTIRCRRCQALYKNQQRRKPVKTIVCQQCGQSFETHSDKKVLCDACYKESVKQKDRQRKNKTKL